MKFDVKNQTNYKFGRMEAHILHEFEFLLFFKKKIITKGTHLQGK